MPKLLRIFLPLVLASLILAAVTSAAPPQMTQNIAGWAKPNMAGDAPGLNSYGFVPAPRTSNMLWVNDIAGGIGWITTINGGGAGDASDYAFQGKYAIEAEYNNFRLIDTTIPGSCPTAFMTCLPVVSNQPCAGSQGDVIVSGNLVIRAHEGTHSVPYGDLTRACEVAGNEIQTVLLDSFNADGDSFTLSWGAGTTIPITRGANNTAAGVAAALQGGAEQQAFSFTGFDTNGESFTLTVNGNTTIPFVRGTNYTAAAILSALQGTAEVQTVQLSNYAADGDSYTLNYNGANTAPIVRGQNNTPAGIQAALQGGNEQQVVTLGSFNGATQSFQVQIGGNNSAAIGLGGFPVTNANVQDAINAIPGFAGTVTVSGAGNTGFTVAYSGASANTDVPSLSIVNCTGACTSSVRESVKGGTGVAGWPTGGTVAVAEATNAIAASPTGATESGNTVTITTTAAHNLAVGNTVTISGVGVGGYNGTFTVASVPTATTFTYTNPTAGLAASGGGTVTNPSRYTLTFGGSHMGNNVSAITVTNGTGTVSGTVTETTAGAPGMLPVGTSVTMGTPNDAGFTLTFPTYAGAVNADVSPFTVTNPVDVGGTAFTAAVRETVKGTAAVAGWPVGGTVTAASLYAGVTAPNLSDEGFKLTFAGTLAAANVATTVGVTNGTGGVTGTASETAPGAPGVTFRGITITDISDPANPQVITGVPMCGNTHTITKYFDDVSGKLFVLGTSGGGTTQPHWGLTSCPAFSSPFGSGFEEVVEIPVTHPEDAQVLSDKRVPVGGNGNCHDVNVFEELHFMATACSGTGGAQIVDMTNIATGGATPLLPGIGFSWPGLQTVHSQAISWSGKYTYVNGEPGGGSGAECAFDDDTNKPMIHILDRSNGKVVGQWMLPRPQDRIGQENCTSHTTNMIPSLNRNLMAWSGYTGGVSVIDFTNPKAPREIASVDPITLNATSGLGCWTGYWYNDNLYCNELNWGQHVFTVNEPWWKQALDMDELNPQTNTKLIRCSVTYTGGPKRAKRSKALTVNVKVFGPAHLQAAWGAKAEIRAPGYFKSVTTGEAGTASATVKATRRGTLSVTVPNMENMIGCSAPSKQIMRAR
jgi:hypothetical protein